MPILLSIKPKYVELIANRSKHFEFRKKNFKIKPDQILVYASSPVKKIVGIIQVDDIVEASPDVLWKKCHKHAGISEEAFFEYFRNRNSGIAIKIKNFVRFERPIDPYKVKEDFTPPQSYAYLENVFPKWLTVQLQNIIRNNGQSNPVTL